MPTDIKDFPLGISGFHFSDLYDVEKLKLLHDEFWNFTNESHPSLRNNLVESRKLSKHHPESAETLIQVARLLGDFIAKLFNITTYTSRLRNATLEIHPIFRFKRDFLHFRVFPRLSENPSSDDEFKELENQLKKIILTDPHLTTVQKTDDELALSELIVFLLDCDKKIKAKTLGGADHQRAQNLCSPFIGTNLIEKVQSALQTAEDWCVQCWIKPSRRERIRDWVSYVRAEKVDFNNLVRTESEDPDLPEKLSGTHLRMRNGFKLTDNRMNQKQYLREVDYCILCHPRQKDSCSTGFLEKDGGYKKNPLGIPLEGCPLDERISEMHTLRKSGDVIASLAMVMLDNPLCPGTGHRICNDCMKGCIFQKQDPVNIPQIETGLLSDVLNLPFGFEIYSLLTRFNPLIQDFPYALPYNGVDVLVVGLGPAGYTLSHYLANAGFGVIGIDALKLEPVDATLTGAGKPFPKPIQNFGDLKKELDERFLMGFGGVSEYGITVRWDKTFLMVIYLTLLRRRNIHFYGGVRFGGTLTVEDAWNLGFQHIAIATGAGKPTVIKMKNNLIKGIRKASDFLMALQLTGAFKRTSLANLQVELPALVIGGGLTAIDTATELLAYYPIQVEKILDRYEKLVAEFGEEKVWQMCDDSERRTLRKFLEHGIAVRNEKLNAEKEHRRPNFITLCREWGGVTIGYRKKMADSPAYRLNHEEIIKALEEGISFLEGVTPLEAISDEFGSLSAVRLNRSGGGEITVPVRTMTVAAGTSPNVIYEREHPGTFELDEKKYFFKKFRAVLKNGSFELIPGKQGDRDAFFLSHEKNGKFVTFYGDNHPDYAGNVVKAMASAKHGFPEILKLFPEAVTKAKSAKGDDSKYQNLVALLDDSLLPRVVKVARLTPTIVEVILQAKYQSQKFEPGQFYRLQNYESSAHMIDGTRLTMEGIALTGAWVDKEKGLLSLIVLEMGVSSRLTALLKPQDPVVVMGPTGTPSEIPKNETVLLAGGGLGNAVLLSIAMALKNNGCRIIYFAGYRTKEDLFKQGDIEKVTDQVIWSVDGGDPIETHRSTDLKFTGNIVQAMVSYGKGQLQTPQLIPLSSVSRILAIGSDRMMRAVCEARHSVLKPILNPEHIAIASINSPMQCMMKEVCAQCLQKHIDPITKKETEPVFSCFNQDQLMDEVDFENLNQRLKMNGLSEKITNQFLDLLFKKGSMERV